MQVKSRDIFATIRTEGSLLPADILQRVAEGDGDIQGLLPTDYHLVESEKLGEFISRSWNRLLAIWKSFKVGIDKLPEHDFGTTLTREKWLLPLFEELHYGRLSASKAVDIEGKSYPISHFWQQSPIHLIGCKVNIDRRTAGVAGAARVSPHSLVQEFLNRSDAHLWAFLSNGLRLRILRDNVSLTRQAFVEFDLAGMMDGEIYSDFILLWLLCHQSRVEVPESKMPELCWLEKWSQTAQQEGTRALEQLRNGVEEAIKALGSGFVAHPANTQLKDKLRAGLLDKQEYYRQLLRLVYRLIFLFVAEDRDLLLDPRAESQAKQCYTKYYSTARLRTLAGKKRGTRHCDLWRALALVFDKLGGTNGCPELGLPALGSFLWSNNAAPDLQGCDMANRDLLEAIQALAFTVEGNVRRAVDYKNLGSEELGSIYEALLELHPDINIEAGVFELSTAAGHERKTTGSYYTPTCLVNCLLDSALEPVLNEALNKKEPEKAILNLKVCDPATGSGHFLIAAAHRIAKRLAIIRTGDEEPSPEALRTALRDVISRCIYGVDMNPMAVELFKVSMWLEALEPGKPLSFLDHHIKCGNSLLGTTPALLKRGIPDEAFKPIEGDGKKLCNVYKKENKEERKKGQKYFVFERAPADPFEQLGALAANIAQLDKLPDNDLVSIQEKQRRYTDIVKSSSYRFSHLLADAWCAAFVWKKTKDFVYPITEQIFRDIERNPHDITPWMIKEIRRLAGEYQFFHWHLEFPEVFRIPVTGEAPDSEQTGWSGGFDCVLGNPPWEKAELLEREWFATERPDIAQAKTGAIRKAMIKDLRTADPFLYREYVTAVRRVDGTRHFIRNSARYPLCSRGRTNTYAVFAETNTLLMNGQGRVGCVVPSGIATDESTKLFFQSLITRGILVSFYDFENRKGIFPTIQGNIKFCLLTLAHEARQSFIIAAQLDDPVLLKDDTRRYRLTRADIERINPNTLNCPTFASCRDAELNKRIYSRIPVLIRDRDEADVNPWSIAFKQGLFNMTSDSHLFCTKEDLEAKGFRLEGNIFTADDVRYLPLYEAKLTSQYNHRAATFEGTPESDRFNMHAGTKTVTATELSDANFTPLPRYWVREKDVRNTCGLRPWFLGFRNAISAVADSRSLVATVLPPYGVGNSMPILLVERPGIEVCFLLGVLNSFVLDYVLRQKASGGNLNFYVFRQLPVVSPKSLKEPRAWLGKRSLATYISSRVLELVCTAWDLQSFSKDCGYDGPPFVWDEERRFRIRAELDAAYFHFYLGTEEDWKKNGSTELLEYFSTPRRAVACIMETFPIVKKRDEREHGTYRSKELILEVYDNMNRAIKTGKPYQTILDPPAADPRVAHLPR